jgi:hypothetical protein
MSDLSQRSFLNKIKPSLLTDVIRGCITKLSDFLSSSVVISDYPCSTLNAVNVVTTAKPERIAVCLCNVNNCNLGPGIISTTTVTAVGTSLQQQQ